MEPSVTDRAYDPTTDRQALWELKRGFELGLGEGTGDDEKTQQYEAKLDDEYRDGYLEWVERCQASEPDAVTVAVRSDPNMDSNVDTDSNTNAGASNPTPSLVGYVFVLPQDHAYIWDAAVLNELYVRPAFRGTGVADGLMERAIETAREQSLPLERLVLDVDRENDRAQAFYDRHGFDHWGEMVARPLE
ncbi:GNAT family N-acetyltransferase [Natronosalvus vescus]|uniref:GNAT family N-acetyltransferase n=1 Tax=Natronosalvus vescus TaxID=2953881 RepID=UPI002091CA34|nr:GNAT family N-acetyltransferase [Natronosalvus vescus]